MYDKTIGNKFFLKLFVALKRAVDNIQMNE